MGDGEGRHGALHGRGEHRRVPATDSGCHGRGRVARCDRTGINGVARDAAWALPDEGANLDVLGALEDMGDGTRSYRGVWEDNGQRRGGRAVAHGDRVQRYDDDADLINRLMAEEAERDALGSAALVHADAEADAASFLVQQVGASAAALADLRADDLSREQRIPQATLAALTANAEIALAQGQLAAYEAAEAGTRRV